MKAMQSLHEKEDNAISGAYRGTCNSCASSEFQQQEARSQYPVKCEESGPSTSGSASKELREGAGDFRFIMNTEALHLIVKTFQCCGSELEVIKDFSCMRGWVAKISLSCSHCKKEIVVTDPYRKEDVCVNSRATLAMRAIGKRRSALQTLSGVMRIMPPVCAQAYISHNKKILEASRELVSLNFAAAELCVGAMDDELVDAKVTCDGTWSKWGFTALYGVVVVASWNTGKVLDVELNSKFCSVYSAYRQMDETSQEFMDWWEVHQSECGCNYIDSSSGMECKGALSIWEWSVKKYMLCYTRRQTS